MAFSIIKITNFRGDLTDGLAKTNTGGVHEGTDKQCIVGKQLVASSVLSVSQ